MLFLPVFHLKVLEITLLSRTIRIDHHQIGKRQNLNSFFLINQDAKIVSIGTPFELILCIDIVAHKHGAKVIVDFVKGHFYNVL